MGSWTGLLPSRPAWDQRAARKSSQVANRSGTAPPSPQGVDEDSPYVLRGLENRKTQLERLTGGLVLEPHPRLFYQDQTFGPPNTYRGLGNEKRQKEISSLVGRCCQTFWERRYPAIENCSVSRGGLSSQFFRGPNDKWSRPLDDNPTAPTIYLPDGQTLSRNTWGKKGRIRLIQSLCTSFGDTSDNRI